MARSLAARSTLEKTTMTSTFQIDDLKLIRHPADKGKPARFDLEFEGRVLDPLIRNDWELAGRCLYMVDSKMANRNGIDAFQIWTNWSREACKEGPMWAVDLSEMTRLWHTFKLTPRTTVPEQKQPLHDDTLMAQRNAEKQRIKTVAEHQRDRYAELLNQLLIAMGTVDGDGKRGDWSGPDLCDIAMSAIPKARELRAVALRIHAKLEHPTAHVTAKDEWDLRAALGIA